MNLRVRREPRSLAAHQVRWVAPLFTSTIAAATPACCCTAPAAYAVVLPPGPALPNPPEILLCAHHLRASQQRLVALGAAVYDDLGRLVES